MARDNPSGTGAKHAAANFLRGTIERDLEAGTWAQRRFGGSPGGGVCHLFRGMRAAARR